MSEMPEYTLRIQVTESRVKTRTDIATAKVSYMWKEISGPCVPRIGERVHIGSSLSLDVAKVTHFVSGQEAEVVVELSEISVDLSVSLVKKLRVYGFESDSK